MPIYKIAERIVAAVDKKGCGVYGQYLIFFCSFILVAVCDGFEHDGLKSVGLFQTLSPLCSGENKLI